VTNHTTLPISVLQVTMSRLAQFPHRDRNSPVFLLTTHVLKTSPTWSEFCLVK